MRLSVAFFLLLWSPPLWAGEAVDRLMSAMRVHDVMTTLSTEGHAQWQDIDDTLLEGKGGPLLRARIEDLYDPDNMADQLSGAIEDSLSQVQLEQATIFFESELGQTIVSLENSARRALTDETIEELARAAYEQADRNTEFYKLLEEYVQVNDLIAQNVEGNFSADLSFYRGLAFGQGQPVDEARVLDDLLSRQDEMTAETTTWMFSYLMLAYNPLNESQIRENIAFSRTETGRALNKALFDGFDNMIDNISYQMGTAVAQALSASDL